jgi:hypothetical protein
VGALCDNSTRLLARLNPYSPGMLTGGNRTPTSGKDTARDATALKDMINILQLQSLRFGEEAPYDGDPESIEHREYNTAGNS